MDGWLAYQRGDYAEALRIWGQLAEQGQAGAQFDLGLMYANGRGVPQNYLQALFWYRVAADQGYAYARDGVGFAHFARVISNGPVECNSTIVSASTHR